MHGHQRKNNGNEVVFTAKQLQMKGNKKVWRGLRCQAAKARVVFSLVYIFLLSVWFVCVCVCAGFSLSLSDSDDSFFPPLLVVCLISCVLIFSLLRLLGSTCFPCPLVLIGVSHTSPLLSSSHRVPVLVVVRPSCCLPFEERCKG